jgi:predicted AAA+ superfamily ATPase
MEEYLKRIADALERAFPLDPDTAFFEKADAFIWEPDRNYFSEVRSISTIDISLLKGMDKEIERVRLNTKAFADGNLANNVLVWGARGMGKSTLIKSVVKATSLKNNNLKIIEVARDNIGQMNSLLKTIKNLDKKFIIFCDDISFDDNETSYKSLKSLLDGGLIGGAQNILIYATSNRRHLLSRKTGNNSDFMRWEEELDERLSISDRFGVSIGFYECDQNLYLEIVRSYAKSFGIDIPIKELERRAIEWQVQRGSRSGRVAKQFIVSLLSSHE